VKTASGEVAARGITASMTIEGGTSRDVFLRSVHEHLDPALRRGEVVVVDDLGAHHATGVREAIEAFGGSTPHLPPYSPDLHPMELCGSVFGDVLRMLGARTRAELREETGIAAEFITRRGFRWCGDRHRRRSRLAL
jgi:hypothetical protein